MSPTIVSGMVTYVGTRHEVRARLLERNPLCDGEPPLPHISAAAAAAAAAAEPKRCVLNGWPPLRTHLAVQ